MIRIIKADKDDSLCRFCKIDTFHTRIVKEFKYCIVVLSNPRLMKGHLLVIPKRHVEKLSELKPIERKELFDTVALYCDKVLKFSKGYAIHQNYMPMLEESMTKVNHMHIHIWPRNYHDEFYKKFLIHEHKLFRDLSEKEINEIIQKLS
jgi:diadenosine tetraphosphate (Ap4A) HIT family hydrolase